MPRRESSIPLKWPVFSVDNRGKFPAIELQRTQISELTRYTKD